MFKNNFFRKVCITQFIFLILICISSNYSDFVLKHTGFLLALIFLIPYEFFYAKDFDEYITAEQENKELHNKIDKAIEYIKNKQVIDLDYLEKILKDSDIDD